MSIIQFPTKGNTVDHVDFSTAFLASVLDALGDHVVAIDQHGVIQYYNESWHAFAESNECIVDAWIGIDYLAECDRAAQRGDALAQTAADGIRSVLAGQKAGFYFEYPCHSEFIKRWFMMTVSKFTVSNTAYFIIIHQSITKLKLQEAKTQYMSDMATIDELTQIANRRKFDDFYETLFRLCGRDKHPVSVAMIDIDYFKLLNDHYGHHVGDEALKSVASVLQSHANRPSDLCARYGGEEFAVIWGDTDFKEASRLCNEMIAQVIELHIPNAQSPVRPYLTISIGLKTLFPHRNDNHQAALETADNLLYHAKKTGRCKVVAEEDLVAH